jgi:hypothetical protein
MGQALPSIESPIKELQVASDELLFTPRLNYLFFFWVFFYINQTMQMLTIVPSVVIKISHKNIVFEVV